MGRKTKISIIAFVVLLVGLAIGAYAVDAARKDQIADGVRIAGIDVGGLEREEAERRLRRQFLEPLREPVTVRFNLRRFKLPAHRLQIRADIRGMVDQAIAVSQEGGLPGRLVRYVTGGEVDEQISAGVGYDQQAVGNFVKRVAEELNQDPVNATIAASGYGLEKVAGENGRRLRANQLRHRIDSVIDAPKGSRFVTATVIRTKPDVTTAELAAEHPAYLTLDRANFTLRLWENLELAREYTVAVGQVGLETPAGLYHIQNKAVDPAWSVPNSAWAGDLAGTVVPGGVPENPLKERWLGIYDGAGIHGTDATYSLGTAASHGCVRMSIPDVIELYDRVPVGTPIYIG